jgi:threonine dehydrogenase-like Zn-dependent dehydrogenase
MASDGDTMRALVKTEAGTGMTLQDVPVPEPGPGEVRLRVKSVGIDGGVEQLIYDWHPSKHFYEEHLPQIFGHEFSGVVDAVGQGVTTVDGGERVAVEPAIVCGECRNCRAGERSLCLSPDRRAIGLSPDVDGALAEYVVVPEETLYPFDDGLSFDVGTFLELVGLGVHGVENSGLEPGDSVAITGPGSAGLGTLIAARAAGATPVAVLGAEVDAASRLPVAEELGADRTLVTGEADLDEPVDVFFEASGAPAALEAAARQMIAHGHIRVNGHKVNVPSYELRVGDIIEVKDSSVSRQMATRNLEMSTSRTVPDWLALNKEAFKGSVVRMPTREDIQPVANEQAVVEFYSR